MISASQIDRLEKLAGLHRSGVLSDQEFETEKAKLLADRPSAFKTAMEGVDLKGSLSLSLPDAIQIGLAPLRRYADFEGRSTRREFWLFLLLVNVANAAAFLLAMFLMFAGGILAALAYLIFAAMAAGVVGVILPLLAVQVRRFHDQGKAGWFVLLNLVPYVGFILVLIIMCLRGTDGENQFGPDPLAI